MLFKSSSSSLYLGGGSCLCTSYGFLQVDERKEDREEGEESKSKKVRE